uniref:Uncharacterized protein n=1 Tax=Ciona intestinalis TaxID=7719 RepID=H2XJS2_CIOIN
MGVARIRFYNSLNALCLLLNGTRNLVLKCVLSSPTLLYYSFNLIFIVFHSLPNVSKSASNRAYTVILPLPFNLISHCISNHVPHCA